MYKTLDYKVEYPRHAYSECLGSKADLIIRRPGYSNLWSCKSHGKKFSYAFFCNKITCFLNILAALFQAPVIATSGTTETVVQAVTPVTFSMVGNVSPNRQVELQQGGIVNMTIPPLMTETSPIYSKCNLARTSTPVTSASHQSPSSKLSTTMLIHRNRKSASPNPSLPGISEKINSCFTSAITSTTPVLSQSPGIQLQVR